MSEAGESEDWLVSVCAMMEFVWVCERKKMDKKLKYFVDVLGSCYMRGSCF